MNNKFSVIGFGEVMLRLSPTGNERVAQGEVFEKKVGGSELNVVSGISALGLRTGIITKIPDNNIGSFIKNKIRNCGVSDDYIVYDRSDEKRLSIYYYENGAYPRKPIVTYDRKNSSFISFESDEINESVFNSTQIFHVSGITLALDKNSRKIAVDLIKKFKGNGVLISFDVNFRATLWSEEEARETILSILPYIDILFVSEETSRRCLKQTGTLEEIMKGFSDRFDIKIVASTQRKVLSPTRHSFSSVIYSEGSYYTEEPYENIEIVDRIGSGDAYLAGVLFGYLKYNDLRCALEIGNAMSALKNTIPGDLPSCDLNEIEGIINTHKSTEAGSEMTR